MQYIGKVQTDTSQATAWVNGCRVWMQERDNGELLLPVPVGAKFGLRLSNRSSELRAYPTFVGDGEGWMNIFPQAPVDPNLVNSNGMWETFPGHAVFIGGFGGQAFVAELNGFRYGGDGFDLLRVFERSGTEEYTARVLDGRTATRSRSVPSSRSTTTSGHRANAVLVEFGQAYNQDTYEVITVRVVDRRQVSCGYGWNVSDLPSRLRAVPH